jgi:hypothetical protein
MNLKPFKPKKKIRYWIGGILLFLILLNIGIGAWIKARIPAIIEEKNDTAYHFEYKDLGFSLFNSSLSVEGISISPKKDFPEKIPLDFTAEIAEIKVVGVNFFKLLRTKDLSAYSIKIIEPKLVYYQSEVKDTTQSKSKLGSVIDINSFIIEDAFFELYDSDRKTKLAEFQNLDLEIGGVNLSERTLEKDIPFTYKNFEMTSGTIFYQLNPVQKLNASSLKVNDNLFYLNQFLIQSDEKIIQVDPKKVNYRLLPDVKAPQVIFTGLDWGYNKADALYFKAEILKFDSVDVNIRNTRERTPDTSRIASHIIPFELNIEKIQIDNSRFRIRNALDAQNINIQIEKVSNIVNDKLTVKSMILDHPEIISYQSNQSKEKVENIATDFIDIIQIEDVSIKNATYKLNQLKENKNLLVVNKVDFSMKNIEINPESYQEKIPILYKNVLLTAASLNYNPNHVYELKSQNIKFQNGNFSLAHFEMKPKISRAQFVKQLKKEQDLYTISAQSIQIPKMNWGFRGNTISFQIPNMELNKVHANVYRSKIPTDDPKKKHLYSKLLRDLPFYLEVNQLNLKNSQVEYEEETVESSGAGKLTFSNFNANVKNVHSGFGKSSLPDVVATIHTNFMNDSRLNAVWTFNPMNRSEKFNIKGSLFSFDAKRMTPFVKPYLHATMEGNMKEVRFNFTGNDINATGDFGVKYDDLKVTLYNSETGKERKVLNTVGNLLVKSSTKEKYNEVKIKPVVRNQDRSFFNFFWNCVLQGLKQSLLII